MKRRWLHALFILSAGLCLPACGSRELPVLGQLPAFQLSNERGGTTASSSLQGKVWVANFVFTSCGHTCPMLTRRMKEFQNRLLALRVKQPDLPARIVSFSVDPERDTPEVLAEYAKRFGADPSIWEFLTGPAEQVQFTVVQGFKIAMGKVPMEGAIAAPNGGEIFDVLHGEKFVLVDQKGRIRGYYASESGQEMRRLLNDLQILLAEPAS